MSRECVSSGILVTRSIVHFVVVMCEQFQPTHLPAIQDSRFHEVLQIFVVGEDVDWETSLFEPVTPVLKTFHNRECFLVGNPIIPLCQIHGLRHEADQMMATIGLLLRKDGTIGVVRGIGFQAELRIGIGMNKDRSLRDVPLQEFEGHLLVLGPLPSLVLLE